MPFLSLLFWTLPYYLFFNVVFLMPAGIIIFIFQIFLVLFMGDTQLVTNICLCLVLLVFMLELWLVYRAAYIKSFENRGFFEAAKDSFNEFRLGIRLFLKF